MVRRPPPEIRGDRRGSGAEGEGSPEGRFNPANKEFSLNPFCISSEDATPVAANEWRRRLLSWGVKNSSRVLRETLFPNKEGLSARVVGGSQHSAWRLGFVHWTLCL